MRLLPIFFFCVVGIGNDSAAEAAARGIAFLPIEIRIGGEDYLDGETLSHREFFEKLVETDEMPQTSQVNEYRFGEAFSSLTADGSEVVAITLSSKLSGTYASAVKAAKPYAGKVYVVDSLNACIGERILMEYAVRLAEEGRGAKEIAALLEEKRGKIMLLAVLEKRVGMKMFQKDVFLNFAGGFKVRRSAPKRATTF